MPTGSLPKEGKALWERVYDKALKGSCENDKECAARTAWSAVKNAGWSKDSSGKWHKKSVLSEFSLYISKASFDKKKQRMNWFAVASDTDEDTFKDNMTESLFDDFVSRIDNRVLPPERYRSDFWSGGNPYMSISHYPDLDGKAVPGVVERVYKDGNRLKASGYFLDTPLGRACFRSICKDLYPEEGDEPSAEGNIRISIAFLDYAHVHKSNGYKFERTEDIPVCVECLKEMFEQSEEGLEFLKGHLIHLALTRVPANARTLIEPLEVDKMAIKTREEDALSIVGDDEEAKSLVEEIAEDVKIVGKSELEKQELVIKADAKEDEPEEDEEEMDKKEDKKSKEKSEISEPSVDFTPILSAIAEMKSDIAELKAAPVEVKVHPIDGFVETFRSSYDEIISKGLGWEDTLQELQEPFNVMSSNIVETVKSTLVEEPENKSEVSNSDVSVEAVTQEVMKLLGPSLEEIKSMVSSIAPQPKEDVRELVKRRSLLPNEFKNQKSLQEEKSAVKSKKGFTIDEVVKATT